MVRRLLLLSILVSLVGCAIPSIEITRTNNHILTPHYSVTIPPDCGWYQNKDINDPDLLDLEKIIPPNVYMMRFLINWVVDESMKSWTAKQVANDYREGEQANMIMMGVMSGQYELKDVIMGEEKVGDKKFFTMTYTTISGEIKGRASLYLYFPKEKNVGSFLFHFIQKHSHLMSPYLNHS